MESALDFGFTLWTLLAIAKSEHKRTRLETWQLYGMHAPVTVTFLQHEYRSYHLQVPKHEYAGYTRR